MSASHKYSIAAAVLLLGAGLFALPGPAADPAPLAPRAHAAQITRLHRASGVFRLAYDAEKCVESCDMQYSTCENNGNDNNYCSLHHDACVSGCYSHKG